METDFSLGLVATARALAVDGVAAEVVRAWREAGIEPILLKGPTLARWLYVRDVRPYGDADLLIDPSQLLAAAEILDQLGFAPVGHHVSLHAHPWVRARDGAEVDLHVRLYGLDYPPERVWRELQDWLEMIVLASVPIRCLGAPGRALQVALHAAQHEGMAKPQEDLRRALEVAPEPVWRDAQRLADRVGGLPTMAAGLSQDPAGRELIARLPLVLAATVVDPSHAPLAIGIARFREATGIGEKLAVLLSALTRPPEDLEKEPWSGAARRLGPRAARAWHILTLLVRAPRTLYALRRQRRP